ncbi:MAG TPA: hypothetical protein VMH00_10650 [Candidatus Limnocylindrales bacterium]|nr:hypothetical protein [Candidatus Limnocylindrales bacterium]
MKNAYKPWAVLSLTLISVAGAGAQQQQSQQQSQGQAQQAQEQPAQPIPAYHAPLAGLASGGDEVTASSDLQPDQRPLAGVQDLALGVPRLEHSFWEPNAVVYSTVDSNPLSSTTGAGWVTYTTMLAGLDLHRVAQSSELTLSYLGGGMVSNDPGVSNSITQEFQLGETLTMRRSALSFFDQMSYAPEMSFGNGAAGLSLPSNLGLQSGFLPQESILTERAQRISNSSIGQYNYDLTPRSSVTLVGGYSLLHFFGEGLDLLNFGDVIFQGGYNYQVTRADTIAVLYNFNADRFSGGSQSINDHKLNVSYGRRVTGRLAFQVAAGPEVASIETSTSGSGTPTSTSTIHAYWSLNSNVTYQLERTSFNATYLHGLNGGSGVLQGAIGDSVSGGVNRAFSRTVGGGINGGYSRNASINGGTASNEVFGYWFGGATLNRSWGQSVNFALNYQAQYQNTNSTYCIGLICGESFVRHMISISLSWRARPLAF